MRVFLEDYYCTSPAWSVKKSAQTVLMAVNSWLHAQTQQSPYRYEKDRGYVCTLSALVLKSTTAHLFHAGDTRIYRLRDGVLEQLTNDHRVWVSSEQSYLSRALGIHSHLDIDYQSLRLEQGDVFVFATDGVHEFASSRIDDQCRQRITRRPGCRGAADRQRSLRARQQGQPHYCRSCASTAFPSRARKKFTGSSPSCRSRPSSCRAWSSTDSPSCASCMRAAAAMCTWPATIATAAPVVIKTLATEMRADVAHLDRFLMEDWVAQRISNAHVVKAAARGRRRNFLYTVTEFVDGQTLHQWLIDHPKPSVETVRGIIEQIANGLLAFHRLEMLHQDLRPQNVMIDATGTVKLIDFGSTRVAGISEIDSPIERGEMLGTLQYTAPEYFLGESGTPRSDLFSLGVIAYQMLSGRLPFGAEVPKARTRAAQRQLKYQSVLDDEREIPAWIDEVLRKATHPDPNRRYEELSEFVYDLRHPTEDYLSRKRAPLLERNPVAFWRGVSLILAVVVVISAAEINLSGVGASTGQ